jgi:hypothetical protein
MQQGVIGIGDAMRTSGEVVIRRVAREGPVQIRDRSLEPLVGCVVFRQGQLPFRPQAAPPIFR